MYIRNQLLFLKVFAIILVILNIKLLFFTPCQPTACKRRIPCLKDDRGGKLPFLQLNSRKTFFSKGKEGKKSGKCWRRSEVSADQKLWPNVDHMKRFVFSKDPLLLGKRRSYKGYLTIGIPTVHRQGAFYLSKTINSILAHSTDEEKDEFIIVICINDNNVTLRNSIMQQIEDSFYDELRDGLIHVISPNFKLYPTLEKLPLLYGDNENRVRWRSKQSLDYSYLFYYSSEIAEYFINLEDDVLAEPNFLKIIKSFEKSRKLKNWTMLEFGARGFIGKFYRSKHLKGLAKYIYLNYWTMPVDWLFRAFNSIFLKAENQNDKLMPPIFKHFGSVSSLKGQKRKLEDFNGIYKKRKLYKHVYQENDNPPASIETTIKDFQFPYDINLPYGRNDFFWGKNPRIGDSITITFPTAIYVKRFVMTSGNEEHPEDTFESVQLSVSRNVLCTKFDLVKSFRKEAIIDFTFENERKLKCIRVQLTQVKENWLLVNEIAIMT